MHASRAELLVVSVPKIIRPAFTPETDALPEVDASLATAWDDFETTCAEVTTALLEVLEKEFDSACKSEEPESLAHAEQTKAVVAKLCNRDPVFVRDSDYLPGVHQAFKASYPGYEEALKSLRDAYQVAVQSYKESHRIQHARDLLNQSMEIGHTIRVPRVGVGQILEGRWEENPDEPEKGYVWVFGRDKTVLEYAASPDHKKIHARGTWFVAGEKGTGRLGLNRSMPGRLPEFSLYFTANPDQPPSRRVADVILQLDNDFSAKIALIDDHTMLFEPVTPHGEPVWIGHRRLGTPIQTTVKKKPTD